VVAITKLEAMRHIPGDRAKAHKREGGQDERTHTPGVAGKMEGATPVLVLHDGMRPESTM
jgi:hypothetical protein